MSRRRPRWWALAGQVSVLLAAVVANVACPATAELAGVSEVRVRGDSTLMGMRIESAQALAGVFAVTTTGARFEYADGRLLIYQGLNEPRRLLATIVLSPAPRFAMGEKTPDHVLFDGKHCALGIYGDSTVLVAPRADMTLKARGNFQPQYIGRDRGELLMIDEKGGMEIYPQRHEAGYEVLALDANRRDWVADYALSAGQRVMIAPFPPRPFDWARAARSDVVIVYGSDGEAPLSPYGQMPSDKTIRSMARSFGILVPWHRGLYVDGSPDPPYRVANPAEFKRLIRTAQAAGLRVAPYSSYFNTYRRLHSDERYYQEAERLVRTWGVQGLYVDGLRFDFHSEPLSDRIANWEMIRRLRQLLGPDGAIVFHGTHLGSPVATTPNIETYCDVVITGENVLVSSLDDPYIRYQVRKYGISNTVGTWLWPTVPSRCASWKPCIDALIKINGGGLSWSQRTIVDGRYVWSDGQTSYFKYYRSKIAAVRQRHLKQGARPRPPVPRPGRGQEDRKSP